MQKARIIEFKMNSEADRGNLIVVENEKDIPFKIQRIFYTYGIKDKQRRGNHSNKKSEFVLIAIKGSCKVDIDYGNNIETFNLNIPNKGLYIPRLLWKEMYDFSTDCILLTLSNELYDKKEYIYDKNEFLAEMKEVKKNEKSVNYYSGLF